MEHVLAAIVAKRAGDKAFVRKLNPAQAAWLKYRDAELEARFPSDNSSAEHASVFPTYWPGVHASVPAEDSGTSRKVTVQLLKGLTVRRGQRAE
jgi:hypothetical protein